MPERVFVKVSCIFDTTGYIMPRSILWKDGRTFRIDRVTDFRPASCYGGKPGESCYTVEIQGQTRYLFFEGRERLFPSRYGRWYVLL